MLEILDIGNTFTRVAKWNGGAFVDLRRLPTGEYSVGKMDAAELLPAFFLLKKNGGRKMEELCRQ